MLRKFSQKCTTTVAIVCMVIGIFFLLGMSSGNTAVFATLQRWSIIDSGWNIVCEANTLTGSWGCNTWQFGSNTVFYNLPFGFWKAFYVWDDPRGWDELVWVMNQDL